MDCFLATFPFFDEIHEWIDDGSAFLANLLGEDEQREVSAIILSVRWKASASATVLMNTSSLESLSCITASSLLALDSSLGNSRGDAVGLFQSVVEDLIPFQYRTFLGDGVVEAFEEEIVEEAFHGDQDVLSSGYEVEQHIGKPRNG